MVTVALFLLCTEEIKKRKVKKRYISIMQYEVSMTVYMGRIVNQRKVPKWLPFENYTLESLNI